ncbi:MAG: hypothetical protein LWW85_07365 [Marinilabiliales bacterium]|nr:hypothetical protein [Marinilabiliales bacterium]
MNSKRLYDKVTTIIGTLMIFFYLGLVYILIFTNIVNTDKSMRVILSIPLMIYGIYRIFWSYQRIKENFFEDDDEN